MAICEYILSRISREGARAYRLYGAGFLGNPYARGSIQAAYWEQGFQCEMQGRFAREQANRARIAREPISNSNRGRMKWRSKSNA